MRKILITGGNCAGKSSTVRQLKEDLEGRAFFAPEAADLFFGAARVPRPWRFASGEQRKAIGKEIGPAAFTIQKEIEDRLVAIANILGTELVICDRGVLDPAAFWAEGVDAFLTQVGATKAEMLARYDLVIQLQSLAVSQPEKYIEIRKPSRCIPVELAAQFDTRLMEIYGDHPSRHFITTSCPFEEVYEQVFSLIVN